MPLPPIQIQLTKFENIEILRQEIELREEELKQTEKYIRGILWEVERQKYLQTVHPLFQQLQTPAEAANLPQFHSNREALAAAVETTAAGVSVAVTAPTVVLTPTPTPPPGFGTEGLTISPTTASPGDPLTLTVVGRPGQVAIIAFSTQNSGARVGSLGLALGPDFGAVGAGPINALGVFLVTRAVPAGLPPGSYFFQAALTTDANTLRDLTLTNGVSLVVGARGSFSASVAGQPTAGAAPLTVAFTSTLTGGVAPYLYAWTFGDGTTSTVANPRKTYSAPGVYLVTLTVTDAEARTVVSNPVTIIVLRDSPS